MRQQAGDRAEAVADALHALCNRAGVALVERVSSHLRLVRGAQGPRTVATKKGTVDCLGVLRGGRAVAIEIKSCASGRLDFDRLPPHQRAVLGRVEQLGGLALVLVVVGGVAHAIPWRAIREALAEGRKGLGAKDVEFYRCDPRRPYLEPFLE
jgi:penicillin-binding protein-related factor A (putative recombinase)